MNGASGTHHIGCLGFGHQGAFCLKQLSLMEIQESFVRPPKPSTCRQWMERAPAGFAFSVRAWLLITHGRESPAFARLTDKQRRHLDDCGFFRWTEPVQRAYRRTIQCAIDLAAHAIVFDTPASFTPTPANRNHLRVFFERIDRPNDIGLVWQPRGVWAPREVDSVCRELQLLAAVDPIVATTWPAGPVAYLKLGAAQYRDGDLFELAQGIQAYGRSYCVFDGSNAGHDALRLRAMLPEVR